jgi:hypothetical protein
MAKIFSHSVGGLFSLETISFVVHKIFNFMLSHLLILSLSCWATWVQLRKSLLMPIASSVFPALPCTSLKVSGLILRSLIHLELILIQDERHGSSFSLLQADIQFSQQNLLNRLLFLHHYVFGIFVKNQVGVAAWIHIWVFYSAPLVFIYVFVSVPCCFYCYGSVA